MAEEINKAKEEEEKTKSVEQPTISAFSDPAEITVLPTDIIDNPLFSVDPNYGVDFSEDTTVLDKQINRLGPKASGIVEKSAAYHRLQGEGRVLDVARSTKLLFGPTIKRLQAKAVHDRAKFEALMSVMPEFDDSKIFGQLHNSEINIADEAVNISNSVRKDLAKISRMAPGTKRYRKLKQKIEKEQGKLVSYDRINQNLLKMRNNGTNRDEWSSMMTEPEKTAWEDIYYGKGDNMRVIDGSIYWIDPNAGEGATMETHPNSFIDLSRSSSPKVKNNQAVKQHLEVTASTISFFDQGGTVDGPAWQFQKNKIFSYLDAMDADAYGSLIWDGVDGGNSMYGGMDTTKFLENIIENNYGNNLGEDEIAAFVQEMKHNGIDHVYKDSTGQQSSLKEQFRKTYLDHQLSMEDEVKRSRSSGSGGSGGSGKSIDGSSGVVPYWQAADHGDATVFDSLTESKWVKGKEGPVGKYNIFDYEEEQAVVVLNKTYGGYAENGEHVYYNDGEKSDWAKDPNSIGTFFFEESSVGDYVTAYYKRGPGESDYESQEFSVDNHDFLGMGENTEEDVKQAGLLQKWMRDLAKSIDVNKNSKKINMGNKKNY